MSSCDLKVVLESKDRRFSPGDTVKGHVDVVVNADCKCNGLTVTRLWSTHGRGNSAEGDEETETLFTGSWRPGHTESYPFEFTVPAGPLTYHGHYLNLDWYLRATADIPWAFDPKAEEEFLVVADRDAKDITAGGNPSAVGANPLVRSMGPVVGAVIGVVVALQGIGFMVAAMLILDVLVPRLMFGGMGFLSVCIGIGIFLYAMRNTLAQRKLGPVGFSVEPDSIRRGEELHCTVTFTPQSTAQLNSVTATLTGREQVVSGSGTNRTTHTHELHNEGVTFDDTKRTVPAGEEVFLEHRFSVPADAPWSIAVSDNHLIWDIQVHIDVASWPDWKQDRRVLVRF